MIVATATLALQAQLVDRDLPALAKAAEPVLARPVGWATLKGRANYACLHRIRDGVPDDQGELVAQEELAPQGSLAEDVVRAREWAEEQASSGGTGDRDRLEPGVSDRAWAQVSVNARECLGATRCPYGAECFAERARARAVEADIVVTNHALLAIDALEGVPVLPEHDVVVVDEGHELAARVTSIAAAELWPGVIDRVGKRSRSHVADDDADALRLAGEALRRAMSDAPVGRLDSLPSELGEAVAVVRDAARAVQSGFSATAKDERDADAESARRSTKAMVDDVFSTAERIVANGEHDVVWLEERESGGRVLRVAPLSVAGLLRRHLFGENVVVATSATLQVGGSFDVAAGSFGLTASAEDRASVQDGGSGKEHATEGERNNSGTDVAAWTGLDVGSPFDYRMQSILYVASDLPPPGRDGLRPEAVDVLARLMTAAGGRTLGLFSSKRAAIEAAEAVRKRLPDMTVLCQGDDVIPTLVREFSRDDETSLFGTISLWQGVDVPGGACRLVVIDRIPFPRPDDPLMSARQRAVERAGGNGFMSVAASHAALLLAQGTGRLIRRATDRGVVAVLDPRLAKARYGSYLRASLPPMWPTDRRDVAEGALKRLNSR